MMSVCVGERTMCVDECVCVDKCVYGGLSVGVRACVWTYVCG